MKISFVIVCVIIVLSSCRANDRVNIKDVTAITLEKGKMTTAKRGDPILQLNCVSGCHLSDLNKVLCRNMGHDGISTQWACSTSDLSNGVDFGDIKVSCEGYSGAKDRDFVVLGSCGLFYGLVRSGGGDVNTKKKTVENIEINKIGGVFGTGFFGYLVLLFVFCVLLCTCCCGKKKNKVIHHLHHHSGNCCNTSTPLHGDIASNLNVSGFNPDSQGTAPSLDDLRQRSGHQ